MKTFNKSSAISFLETIKTKLHEDVVLELTSSYNLEILKDIGASKQEIEWAEKNADISFLADELMVAVMKLEKKIKELRK